MGSYMDPHFPMPYKTTYTTHTQPRDEKLPRTGSFVEFEFIPDSQENQQTHTYVFSCLTDEKPRCL